MKNNEQIILQILENATIIFESSIYYNKFVNHIIKNEFQQARYFLDIEMDLISKTENNSLKYDLYDKTENLLMDLIINEIDGAERENKKYFTNTR